MSKPQRAVEQRQSGFIRKGKALVFTSRTNATLTPGAANALLSKLREERSARILGGVRRKRPFKARATEHKPLDALRHRGIMNCMSAFKVNVIARNPKREELATKPLEALVDTCLLYTSDAADE